jgi:hypothetical protein
MGFPIDSQIYYSTRSGRIKNALRHQAIQGNSKSASRSTVDFACRNKIQNKTYGRHRPSNLVHYNKGL